MAPMCHSRLWKALGLLSSCISWWPVQPQALASTLLVSPSGSSHYPTIQSALNAASPGDTVLLLPGTYLGSGNKNLSFLGKDLVLKSRDGASATIIDCQYDGRGVSLESGETLAARVEGVTIRNGDPDGLGGGMIVDHSAASLRSVRLEGNRASNQGGMLVSYGAAHLDSVQFVGNSASQNAGGLGIYESAVEIHNSSFVGNHALWGGGIKCTSSSSLSLEGVLFDGNSAAWGGGGMYLPDPSCEISIGNTQFRANTVSYGNGGGLYLYNSSPALSGCLFEANLANLFGGAIYIAGDSANVDIQGTQFLRNASLEPGGDGGALFLDWYTQCSVRNCTFAGNYALEADRGGTIELVGYSQLLIERSIIAHTTLGYAICALDGGGAVLTHCDLYGNLYGDVGCESAPGIVLNECLSLDPLLCDYPQGDVSLGEDSPCLPGNNAWGVVIGADSTVCVSTGVEPYETGLGARPSSLNYPNPFNPSTVIAFSLPEQSQVQLAIVDVAGRLVRTLTEGEIWAAGNHELNWDGLDDEGRGMPSGVYFYRLETNAGTVTKQMVMLR